MNELPVEHPPDSPRRSLLVDRLALVTCAMASLVALLTAADFLAKVNWRLEQAAHFRLQYAVLLLIAATLLVIWRRRRAALLALVVALVNIAVIAPIYWPAGPSVPGQVHKRLLSLNVLSRNPEKLRVIDYLRQQDADIVLLMEVDSGWDQQCESLRDVYPYQHRVPRQDNFGIALLSKRPWSDIQTVELGNAELPTIVAKYVLNGQSFDIIGTHPLPPGSARMAESRNDQLRAIAQLVRDQQDPTIVVGDLNVTSYSPYFHDLLREGNLHDSRQGFGIHASWSPGIPGLEIPIDHCLVSPNIVVHQREVGPYLGSDHRPVMVEFSMSAAGADHAVSRS